MLADVLPVLHTKIKNVNDRRYVTLADGRKKQITGAVTTEEAMRLAEVVLERGCRNTLETGVAFGVSTLAIMLAFDALNDPGAVHYGVDPEQHTVHQGAALALQKEHGVSSRFELLEGPSHEILPVLLHRGVQLDFAFIDGWHTFDYTLLDFFYIDKMLRVSGVVAFHDSSWPSTRKVHGYLSTHRRYRLLPYPKATLVDSIRNALAFARNGKLDVGFILARKANLLMFEKVEGWEPNHDYFVNF